jgi:hypothetical protein
VGVLSSDLVDHCLVNMEDKNNRVFKQDSFLKFMFSGGGRQI